MSDHPSVFQDFGHARSFAVQYFEQCNSLKKILQKITRKSSKQHEEKCKELDHVQEQYNELFERWEDTECEYRTVSSYNGDSYSRHHEKCSRCALEDEMNLLNITIYEKPLSPIPSVARATVFELQVPECYSDWRDVTRFLTTELLGINCQLIARLPKSLKAANIISLKQHPELASHMSHENEQYQNRRIVAMSTVKPRAKTCRPSKPIPDLGIDDVSVPSPLRLAYYDKGLEIFNKVTPQPTDEIQTQCMHKLAIKSKCLERYMQRPPSSPDGLPSNQVIANQIDCPPHFSMDEFKAFGSLPLGQAIMYENVLVQLSMPLLDFSKSEIHSLFQQVVNQAGTPNDTAERLLHGSLRDTSLCESLLARLEIIMQQTSGNWESWRAMVTFSLLARRILSLSLKRSTIDRALRCLGSVRRICLQWLQSLDRRIPSSSDHSQRSELYSRILDISLVVISTFDVDEIFFEEILQEPIATSALIQCSIRIRENQRLKRQDPGGLRKTMHNSWIRLMYQILPYLQENLSSNIASLNQAILDSWPTFQSSSRKKWTFKKRPYDQWLHTTSGQLSVDFDLLTGELLVNSLPLTRLPEKYTRQSMFTTLFQQSILEVGPSDVIGMTFCGKAICHGYALHFGMADDDLRIMAVRGSTK